MHKTSRAAPARLVRPPILLGSAVAAAPALILAIGCSADPPAATGSSASGAATSGAGVGGLTAGGNATGNDATTPGGGVGANGGMNGTPAGSPGPGTAGAPAGNAGTGGAAAGPGGGMSTGGTAAEPCVDVEPPPDPQWPEATCAKWATETPECGQPWFANYCDVSCGRCVPQGSGGAGAGAGGTGPEPCVDVEPPPDPQWPGATCTNWATETTECSAAWFAEYCDASCGRCVADGGAGTGSAGTGGTAGVDCSNAGLPNVTGGNGHATRYWDCCQPHCAQFDGHRCGQDGVSRTGDQTSACTGGGSFACYDESPHAVSDCLSYGYIAKANPNCGACYRIQFTGEGQHNADDPGSRLIRGKQMIVKVSNTGSDVGENQFDLMIPGGGAGRFNACTRQWGTSDLGAQYGGFLTDCAGTHAEKKECVRRECMKIPAGAARDGCLWFVDWLEVADNPKFTSEATNCPF